MCINRNEHEDIEFSTHLTKMMYADDLSFGVLTFEKEGDRPETITEVLNGKQTETTLSMHRVEQIFCAVNAYGNPKCSKWQVTFCQNNERQITYSNGEIVVKHGRSTSDTCFVQMIEPGVYSLFETDFHKPIGTHTYENNYDKASSLETSPMFGPFSSIKAYCNSLPYTHEEDEYDGESVGAKGPMPRCVWGKDAWSRYQPKRNNGPIKAAKLLTVKTDIAGAPAEYCHIAMKTKDGWFVSVESGLCQGSPGPSEKVKTTTRKLIWTGDKKHPVLVIVSKKEVTYTKYHNLVPSFPMDDPWSIFKESMDQNSYAPLNYSNSNKAMFEYAGNKVKVPSIGDFERQSSSMSRDRVAQIRFCGMGSSDIPSCSDQILLGCHNKKVYNSWSIEKNKLKLENPGEHIEDCNVDPELEFGLHELIFP